MAWRKRQGRRSKPVSSGGESINLGDVVRGTPTFLSLLAIGFVVTLVVGIAVAFPIAIAFSYLSLPYDSPLGWIPDGAWHWGVTWLALGGLSGGIGAWAGSRSFRWLGGGKKEPRFRPQLIWGLGAISAMLLGAGLYLVGQMLEEDHVEVLQRKSVAPERVCEYDPDLPPPSMREGHRVYDTNGDGRPDVMVERSPPKDAFAVAIDAAESGRWPTIEYCVKGDLRASLPTPKAERAASSAG
jgi:hypothetical protein